MEYISQTLRWVPYITKRIDRTESGEKIHVLDMFQITEAFYKYKSSMEKIVLEVRESSLHKKLFATW